VREAEDLCLKSRVVGGECLGNHRAEQQASASKNPVDLPLHAADPVGPFVREITPFGPA
jgi:hypothetical protein